MNHRFHRREFLAGAAAASCAIPHVSEAQQEGPAGTGGLLDIHVHLFGIGDTDSGCRLSKAIKDGYLFKYLSARLRIHQRAKTLDEGYVIALADHVKKSGLDKAVIIGQDAVYDGNGKPNWPKTPALGHPSLGHAATWPLPPANRPDAGLALRHWCLKAMPQAR